MSRFKLCRAAIFAAAVGVALSSATTASAGVINTFDSSGDTAGWTVDRYAPAGFTSGVSGGGRTGVLDLSIDGGAQQSNTFYDYQGRKYDLSSGSTSLFVDMFVPSSTPGFRGELWATGVDNTNAISAFPIIEYSSADGGFRTWDYINGGWTNIGGFTGANQWYQIGFGLANNELTYYVNGVAEGSIFDPDTVGFSNVILQGYNSGTSYDVFFDNLSSSPVPEPATLAVFGLLGLTAFGFRFRRKMMA